MASPSGVGFCFAFILSILSIPYLRSSVNIIKEPTCAKQAKYLLSYESEEMDARAGAYFGESIQSLRSKVSTCRSVATLAV